MILEKEISMLQSYLESIKTTKEVNQEKANTN